MKVKIANIETRTEQEKITNRELRVTEISYDLFDDDGMFLHSFNKRVKYPLSGPWGHKKFPNSGMADNLDIEYYSPPGISLRHIR